MRICVCVDNKKASRKAVNQAIEFAELSDVEITIIHSVKKNLESNGNEVVKESQEKAINRSRSIIDKYEDIVSKEIDKVDSKILTGDEDPVEDVISYVNNNDFGYVFIGHRGLEDKHEVFGSFARNMISKCDVPVIVV